MAYDTSFDYDRLLSLDQAKLVGRTRINALGSYELTLNYNKITSATKEDCLEYLEDPVVGRLTMLNPTFSNKTYEGTWKCVSIAYDENKSIIQQVFKIDSQVGNLGDVDDEPDYGAQEGDLAQSSFGGTVEKAYYWKVVNPTDVELPLAREGEIWTKTANDNGDGTYDVVVSKSVVTDQTATSENRVGGEDSLGATDSIFVYRSTDPLANGEYTLTSGVGPPNWYDGSVVGTDDTRIWRNANSYTISKSGTWNIYNSSHAVIYTKTGANLNSFGWTESGSVAFIVVQVGANESLFTEVTDTSTNSDELSFVSDGGTIADPTIGQEITIQNSPNDNGTFRSSVTTRTMNFQRIPAMEDSIIFGGDGPTGEAYADRDRNAFVWGRNASYEQFQSDVDFVTNNKNGLSNMVSASLNKWGLYDYTIRSVEI